MWLNTWPRPTPQERSTDQIDEAVSGTIAEIYASRNVAQDMTGRSVHAIVWESELAHESGSTYYAYNYWLDGLDLTYPGLQPGSVIAGFCSSVVGTYNGLVLGESQITIGVEELAAWLGTQFGHPPVFIRRYAIVPAEPARADYVPSV